MDTKIVNGFMILENERQRLSDIEKKKKQSSSKKTKWQTQR